MENLIPPRVAAMLDPEIRQRLDVEFTWLLNRCAKLGIHFCTNGDIVCEDLEGGYSTMPDNHVRCILKKDFLQQIGHAIPPKHVDIFFEVMRMNVKKCYEHEEGKKFFVNREGKPCSTVST